MLKSRLRVVASRGRAQAIREGKRDRYSLAEPKALEVMCLLKHFENTFQADKKVISKLIKALRIIQTDLQPKCRQSTKYAVCKLASSHLVRLALQIRRKAVGTLLGIKKNIMELQLYNESDFGPRQHTASGEPYFYDAAYTMSSPIAVQNNGQSRLSHVKYPQQIKGATEGEKKDVLYWECNSCCKLVSVQDIVDTKLLFEGNIPDMRKSLDELDQWHYPCTNL